MMYGNEHLPRRRSFCEAIREKYAHVDDDSEVVVDNLIIDIRVSSRDLRRKTLAEFDFLRNVVLNNQNVGFAGIPTGGLVTLCPNVIDLDLSGNCIESWSEILPMLSELPNLKFVNLCNNPLRQDQCNKEYLKAWAAEMKLENLVLNGTATSWEDALRLSRTLPCLTELHLGNNGYEYLGIDDLDPIRNLQCLHLHDNNIRDWSEIWKLCGLTQLQTLILSGNPINDIYYKRRNYITEDVTMEDNNSTNADIALFLLDEIIRDVTAEDNRDVCENIICHGSSSGDYEVNDYKMKTEETCEKMNRNTKEPSEVFMDISSDERGYDFDYGYSNCDRNLGCSLNNNNNNNNVEVFCKNSSLRFWISLDNCGGYNSGKNLNKNNRRKCRRNNRHNTAEQRNKNIESRIRNNNINNNSNTDARIHGEIDRITNSGGNKHDKIIINETNCNESAMESSQRDGLAMENSKHAGLAMENSQKESVVENSERDEAATQPFQCLKHLCLTNTLLSSLEQLITMRHFPSLSSLKIMGIQLEGHMEKAEDRRKLFVACLPTISVLNGSEITAADRESAERHFLRYFSDKTPQPSNVAELENKHGKLEPLADIDLSYGFREWVNLKFVYRGDVVKRANVHITKPVAVLRKFISHRLADQYGINIFRMWHYACAPHHGEQSGELTEIFLDSLPMSRFDIMDGDEIHIEGL